MSSEATQFCGFSLVMLSASKDGVPGLSSPSPTVPPLSSSPCRGPTYQKEKTLLGLLQLCYSLSKHYGYFRLSFSIPSEVGATGSSLSRLVL